MNYAESVMHIIRKQGDKGYLEATDEVEEAFNRLLKVKTNQVNIILKKFRDD